MQMTSGEGMSSGLLIAVCYCLLSVSTYFIWPSRWNVIAHINLGFAAIAYVLPVLVLRQHDAFPDQLLSYFARIMVLGTVSFLVGQSAGALLAGRKMGSLQLARIGRLDRLSLSTTPRRLFFVVGAGVIFTCVAAFYLGGLPLFAEDPYSAKYFRGEYRVDSPMVSLLYRMGTGILTVTLPLAVAIALGRRVRLGWILLAATATFFMISTLQRGPMAEGLLILVAVLFVQKRRFLLCAITIGGSYVFGTLFYDVLRLLEVGQFAAGSPVRLSLAQRVASTAPDVTDTLKFLLAWTRQGEPLTYGNTMWGGLLPGQYEWNPAVWSLVTQNYGDNINDIRSGGLRLPVPVWGAVNFGDVGVLVVPLIAGFLVGFAVKRLAAGVPSETLFGTVSQLLLMNMLLLTLGSFYILAYLEVFKISVLLWSLWPSLRKEKEEGRIKLALRDG